MHRCDYPTARELTEQLGGRWNDRMRRGEAPCPAHDDRHPSLDIVEKNGKILLICRSRCTQDAVLEQLRARGLWPARKAKANGHAGPGHIVATYDYRTADGVRRFQAVRYQPKTFKTRRQDGDGKWIWNLPLDPFHRFLPFHLPEVLEAIALGQPIFVLEGEKDVENGSSKLGIVATCNAGGAGKWTDEHAAYLTGADVITIPDNDEPGRLHAEDVAESLVGIARRVRLLDLPHLPPKGDLTDWIETGGTAEELRALVEKAPEWSPPPNRRKRRAVSSAIRRLVSTKLSAVDMRQIEWVWLGRVAVGKHTTIAGEPSVGKSTLLYWIAATVSKGGDWPCGEGTAPKGTVLILSAEDGVEDTIKPRILAAGGDADKVEVITATRDEKDGLASFNLQADLQALEDKITGIGDVVLVIIDPISSYLGGADGHSNTDVRSVVEPLHEMADRLKVAVLTNSHFSKAGAANKSRASHRFIGSIAFVALPRVAFAVVPDPEVEGRRLVLHVKNNIAPAAPGLAFQLGQKLAGYIGDPRQPLYASCVEWEGEHVAKTADQAISEHEANLRGAGRELETKPQTEAQQQAAEFLRSWLKDGPSMKKEIERAAKGAGITEKVLRGVRERICDTSDVRDDKGRIIGSQWTLKTPKPEPCNQ